MGATTIWKYRLLTRGDGATDRPLIYMPKGAEPLTVQVQDGEPTVWVLVDPDAPPEPRTLLIVGTGWQVPDDAGRYIGTWQTGVFVFHLFDVVPAREPVGASHG